MPTGRMRWFDDATGEGRIVASGREYPTDDADVEPHARTTGARVHFDIRRVDGVARAVRVTALAGTRTSRRQRRFGDQTGSAHPEEKGRTPLTRGHPTVEPSYVGRPVALVRHWIRAADSGNVEGVLPLYAPDAVVHAASGDHRGRAAIRIFLLDSGLLTRGWRARPTGDGDDVTAVRQGTAADAGRTSRFRTAHGEIVEQWDEQPGSRR